jgi:tetratricopeptide (TPR) repeat protein
MYRLMRDYPEAERVADRAIALAPDLPAAYGGKMLVRLNREGRLDSVCVVMREALSHVDFGKLLAEASWPAGVLCAADSAYGTKLAALQLASFGRDVLGYFATKAAAYRVRGEAARSRTYYDSLAAAARAQLQDRPDDALTHGTLGVAEAYLGRQAEALQEGRRGVELLPPSKDAYFATFAELALAEIYATVGQPGAAVDQLRTVLAVPSDVSPAGLQADPTWAPLRGNPRFERLVAGK